MFLILAISECYTVINNTPKIGNHLTSSICQVLVILLPCSKTSPVLPHNALCPLDASQYMAFLWNAERSKSSRAHSVCCAWCSRVLGAHKTQSNITL